MTGFSPMRESIVAWISFRHCEEITLVIDEVISGYLPRLPRSEQMLAMTIW